MKKKKTAGESKTADTTLVLNKETLKNLVGKLRTGVRTGGALPLKNIDQDTRSQTGCCGPATCCGT
jgi:hypothetical protein